MKYFKDWNIRSKLILPLFAVVVLGGGGIIWTFVGMYDDVVNDALPEERALDGIRRASLELLSEYREFMLVPSESTQREISELKEEIEAYEAAFEHSALSDEAEAPFVAAIEAAEQSLKLHGDTAIVVRRRLLDQVGAMEAFEGALDDLPASSGPADAETVKTGDDSKLEELVHEYLAELREYALAPSDETRQEIAEIEQSLKQITLTSDERASEGAVQAGDAAKRLLIQELLETGSGTMALTDEFLAELEAIEEIEDDLLKVLEAAGSVIARKTDSAFTIGFAIVVVVILAVLATIFLVGYLVSQGIGKPITALAAAADRFGGGDLSVRADVTSKDEIGGLATAFNRMAASLESNIDQRKRAEEAIRKTDALIRALITNSPAETFVQDAEGRYILVNKAWTERMGLTEENVLGKTNQEALSGEQAAIYIKQNRAVRETGLVLDEEVRIPLGDQVRTVHTINFPLVDDDGNIVGVGGIASDVTDIKRAEMELRQAQKMEAVGQLTGGIAHDFNNLLAVIMGNTELLKDRSKQEDTPLNAILRAAKRGAELTQRLLAFSRQQPLSPQAIDLGELASGMSGLLIRTLGETIEVETKADPNLWSALADAGQVENALLNLALNARDAMPDGGKLTIECANVHLDGSYVAEDFEVKVGDYVVLAVSDDGSGMTAEAQAHAFEPFFTTKEVGQGSGLGLSMAYGFAKQSGGHVSIYSEEGLGTTVKLYLPRAEKASKTEAALPSEEVPRGRGEVILVIEDNPDVRDLAVTMLEGLGYRTIDVPDAASAGKVLADGKPVDLMLSDVVLPSGISGPKFAEEALATYRDLKVVFMSGYPDEAAKRNGFLDSDKKLLNKPFKKQELAEALRDELDGSPANGAVSAIGGGSGLTAARPNHTR